MGYVLEEYNLYKAEVFARVESDVDADTHEEGEVSA
jgi:hypothetical protein